MVPQGDFERVRGEMEKDAKRAAKLEQKVNLLTGGYSLRAEATQTRVVEQFDQVNVSETPWSCMISHCLLAGPLGCIRIISAFDKIFLVVKQLSCFIVISYQYCCPGVTISLNAIWTDGGAQEILSRDGCYGKVMYTSTTSMIKSVVLRCMHRIMNTTPQF